MRSLLLILMMLFIGCSHTYEHKAVITKIKRYGPNKCAYTMWASPWYWSYVTDCGCFDVGDTVVLVRKNTVEKP